MIRFVARYWFLFALGLAMSAGFIFANPMEQVSSWRWLRNGIVMTVMFVMALPLPMSSIRQTIRRPWAAMLASAVNLVLLPMVAWLISRGLITEHSAGLLVVAATPCTLASAAVWTRRAGGNDVTALMTTVFTNSICFLATPAIVFLLLNRTADISFSEMVVRLGSLVLIPICLAQLLASRQSIGQWARDRKSQLGVSAQVGILMIVLLGTAQSTLRVTGEGDSSAVLDLVVLVIACGVLHLVVLVAGSRLAKMAGFSREDQIAVAFAGSQKTLMIGLLVCLMLKISLVPMVTYHAVQLIIDTFVADRYLARDTGG